MWQWWVSLSSSAVVICASPKTLVVLDFSRPSKPTDNAYIESFNGKFRAECLNQHWFLTLGDTRQNDSGNEVPAAALPSSGP